MALMMDQLMSVASLAPAESAQGKLQAHKSSFQAWKCVSFGCSLLAIMLLWSKWQEVTTDLNLLVGVGRLLELQANGSAHSSSLSWPPVPLEQLLPSLAGNESALAFGLHTLESNDSMLMSHMHMSLNRELNGNQLLRQEVEVFVAEFRNAQSTLSLSALMVSVYIVSWVLMTLAISDARISNDISLRNILLLSVFGAIDMAASVGFVMVRVIMYSVKNNTFASEILATGGLKDTPIRLSADQLTAFTALRLIAMRSCSAYVDVYVSVVVALLTILRLYAIFKALGYYRRLRRSNDRFQYHQLQMEQQHNNQQAEQKQIWTSSFVANNGASSADNAAGRANGVARRLVSPSVLNNAPRLSSPAHHHFAGASFHPLGLIQEADNKQQASSFRYAQQPTQSTNSLPPLNKQAGQQQHLTKNSAPSLIILNQPRETQQTQFQYHTLQQQQQQQHQSALNLQRRQSRPPTYQANGSSGPSVVLVKASPAFAAADELRPKRPLDESQQASRQSKLLGESLEANESETTASACDQRQQQAKLIVLGDDGAEQRVEAEFEQQQQQQQPTFGTLRSADGATYTLLSAQQLEKLSRKLAGEQKSGHKYKLANRYKLAARSSSFVGQKREAGDSYSSSGSCGADDSDNSLVAARHQQQQQLRQQRRHSVQQPHTLLTRLRQSEELLSSDALQKQFVAERQLLELAAEPVELSALPSGKTGATQQLLLGKYYYA